MLLQVLLSFLFLSTAVHSRVLDCELLHYYFTIIIIIIIIIMHYYYY